MQAVLMRCVVRDPRTNQIKGYGEPIHIPKARANYLLVNKPLNLEIVEDNVEVPDDDRGNPHGSISFTPVNSLADLSGPATVRAKGRG